MADMCADFYAHFHHELGEKSYFPSGARKLVIIVYLLCFKQALPNIIIMKVVLDKTRRFSKSCFCHCRFGYGGK